MTNRLVLLALKREGMAYHRHFCCPNVVSIAFHAVECSDRSWYVEASLILWLIYAGGCIMHDHLVYYTSIQYNCATPPRLCKSCLYALVVCLLELRLPYIEV